MSARAMSWAWDRISQGHVPGGPAVALVLLRLADRADPSGHCWPGHERTSQDLQMAKSTVKACIRSLAQAGLLAIQAREIGGRSASNLYILAVDNLPEAAQGGGAEIQPPGGDLQQIRGPDFGPEPTTTKEPPKKRGHARPAHAARRDAGHSLLGGGEFVIDPKTGIHHNPDDQRDAQAVARILTFQPTAVAKAVQQAASLDPAGRAFPSATLRILLRTQAGHEEPAWALGSQTHEHPRGGEVVDGEMKWTD